MIGTDETVAVRLRVNGGERTGHAHARTSLADFVRRELGLTGTHLGCEHGVCGACTVLVSGRPVRACLMLAVQAEGAEITTVEGLARPGETTPLQDAFREHHALQCGYCTPGMLLSAEALLSERPEATESEIRDWLHGNLCRCTGYQQIVEAVQAVVRGGA